MDCVLGRWLTGVGEIVQDEVVAVAALAVVALAQRGAGVGTAIAEALQAVDEAGRAEVDAGIEEVGVAVDARGEVPAAAVQGLDDLGVERAQDGKGNRGGDEQEAA